MIKPRKSHLAFSHFTSLPTSIVYYNQFHFYYYDYYYYRKLSAQQQQKGLRDTKVYFDSLLTSDSNLNNSLFYSLVLLNIKG